MSQRHEYKKRVLSIYPTRIGFAYAFFESPKELVDWDNCRLQDEDLSKRVQILIDVLQPNVLVAEDNKDLSFYRGERIAKKLDEIYQLAQQNKIFLERQSRAAVKVLFRRFNAENEHETARLLSRWFPGLYRLPPKPKVWNRKHYRMGLFDAVSFALTYYHKND